MNINRHIIISLSLFVLVVIGGSFVYHNIEGWSKLDSLYFVVVTVTTIGYGDLAPVTAVGKIFTIFFSFFGIGMAFYFLSLIGSWIFKKHITKHTKDIKKTLKIKNSIKPKR